MQQAVVEFILNHTEQIFNRGTGLCKAKEGRPPQTLRTQSQPRPKGTAVAPLTVLAIK